MPIAFHDAADVGHLGSAGFLKVVAGQAGAVRLGALLVLNARGEPLEFAYNRVELPQAFLWRPADLRRHAERRLIASLLTICTHSPTLLLVLADEVSSALFGLDLHVTVPVARIGQPGDTPRRVDRATGEVLDECPPTHVSWYPNPPLEGSPERRLFDHLSARGLLLEPFDRATLGLSEVYAAPDADTE